MASVVPPAGAAACRHRRHCFCRRPDHGPVGFPGRSVPERHSALRSHDGGHRPAEPPVRSDYVQQQWLSLTASESGVRGGWGRFHAGGVRQLCGLEKPLDAPGTNDVHVRIQSRSRLLRSGPHQGSRAPYCGTGDNVIFDELSRKEYGDVPSAFRAGKRVVTEMVGQRVEVVGLFDAGTSFGIDGAVVMSDANFFRLMPGRSPEVVNFGLIKLKPGFDPDRVRAQLAKALPNDVRVLTHSQLDAAEREFWSSNTPIGFIFALGVFLGLVVGIIVVYQILYTDVTDHLQEYATLKAIGYKDSFLFAIIIYESVILSVFGYIPGFFISLLIYHIARDATFLPLQMTAERGVVVYLLTLGMCVAIRRSGAAPAEKGGPRRNFLRNRGSRGRRKQLNGWLHLFGAWSPGETPRTSFMTEMYPMEIGRARQVLTADEIFDLVREDLHSVEKAIGIESVRVRRHRNAHFEVPAAERRGASARGAAPAVRPVRGRRRQQDGHPTGRGGGNAARGRPGSRRRDRRGADAPRPGLRPTFSRPTAPACWRATGCTCGLSGWRSRNAFSTWRSARPK